MPEIAPLDPERIVRVLAEHGVDYVLIGALAARLQGFPRLTADIDITPARNPENLGRLAAALRELDSRVYTVDMAPTLAALLGLPHWPEVDGRNLTPLLAAASQPEADAAAAN